MLKGLWFVRVTNEDREHDELPDVMYGQVFDSADGLVLVEYWATVPDEPIGDLTLENLVDLGAEAKFYRTHDEARAEFVELTRSPSTN